MTMSKITFCIITLFLLSAFIYGVSGKKSKESWGYIEVRPGAQMFWWLYYANVSVSSYTAVPLVIWLQGGPGASSTGFGNFLEIGPFDTKLKPREHSWITKSNLLFIDNPVGTGFSYVTNKTQLCTNNEQIAKDLVTLLKGFLSRVTEFRKVPLYIFSESYGGKMAIQFATELVKEMKSGKVKTAFKGVALGSSWISPIDFVASWGPYLNSLSYVGRSGESRLKDSAVKVMKAVASGNFSLATDLWGQSEALVESLTHGVSFYNVQYPIKQNLTLFSNSVKPTYEEVMKKVLETFDDEALSKFMNGPVKRNLTVIPKNVTWGGQKDMVFEALKEDFMKSVAGEVESVLNNTNIPVFVFNGQFDLICNVLGASDWIHNLNWPGKSQFEKAVRRPIYLKSGLNIFHKNFKNLHFYQILRAGHMVPADNPEAGLKLLDSIINSK